VTWRTTFWLLVPVLLLNGALASSLPEPYQSPAFDAIPVWLAVAEGILRVGVFGAPLVLPLALEGPRHRAGWFCYGVGLLAYGASWAAVIRWPESGWSRSLLGFTAPAWTPGLWLLGMALLSGRVPFTKVGAAAPYGVVCGVFLLVHVGHAVWVHPG